MKPLLFAPLAILALQACLPGEQRGSSACQDHCNDISETAMLIINSGSSEDVFTEADMKVACGSLPNTSDCEECNMAMQSEIYDQYIVTSDCGQGLSIDDIREGLGVGDDDDEWLEEVQEGCLSVCDDAGLTY
jgi:hypothetical protein